MEHVLIYFETADSFLFNLKLSKTLSPKRLELLKVIFNFANAQQSKDLLSKHYKLGSRIALVINHGSLIKSLLPRTKEFGN
jgi:hypothetical protein